MGDFRFSRPGRRRRTIAIRALIALITAPLFLLSSCEGAFRLSSVLGLSAGDMVITPDAATISNAGTVNLSVSGGLQPVIVLDDPEQRLLEVLMSDPQYSSQFVKEADGAIRPRSEALPDSLPFVDQAQDLQLAFNLSY